MKRKRPARGGGAVNSDPNDFSKMAEVDGLLLDEELSWWRDGDATGLAALLRSDAELDPTTRELIALILEGKSKRKRGAKATKFVAQIMGDRIGIPTLNLELARERVMLEAKGVRAPAEQARAIVAERYQVSVDTIDRLLHPRAPKKSS